jgi:Uma2 family endonuclease
MATTTLISVEEYLHTVYEHDCEYVYGEIVERGMPTNKHSQAQEAISGIVWSRRMPGQSLLWARPELRTRLEPALFRIPDVAIYSAKPEDQVPSDPPLVAVEILSPDERHLLRKCEEYRQWGVPHIWIADPQTRKLSVFDETGFRFVPEFSLPQFGLTITAAQLFD